MNIKGDIGTLSSSLLRNMNDFGSFIGADEIKYIDKGNSEELKITKDNKSFIIKACGNKFDGGFFGYAKESNSNV